MQTVIVAELARNFGDPIVETPCELGVARPMSLAVPDGGQPDMNGKGYHLFYPPNSGIVNGRFLLADGKWYPRTSGCRSLKDAKKEVPRIIEELSAKLGLPLPPWHPDYQGGAAVAPKKKSNARKSTRVLGNIELAKYAKRQRLSDTKNFNSATRWMWKRLKDKADLEPSDQQPKYFEEIREQLLDSELSQRSVELYAKKIREYLTLLIPLGLDSACAAVFERMPKKPDSEDRGGEPFTRTHLQVILTILATASELIQSLIWIGLSGAPQIIDAVFLPFSAINWKTGMIYYQRVKTGERIRFCAMPPLLRLLRKRFQRLGPHAIYVFPELIFTQEEQQIRPVGATFRSAAENPFCNTAEWLQNWKGWKKVPDQTRKRSSGYGMVRIASFLTQIGIKTDAGLPTDGLTFKSFRQHHISFWSSLGIKLSVRMLMAGHSKKDPHGTYDIPTDDELIQAMKITWSYLKAVKRGKPFFVPTCQYEIYRALVNKWDAFPELMRSMFKQELGVGFDALRQLILDCTMELRAHAAEQSAILQRENARLMERSIAQENLIAHIGAALVKISGRLGCDIGDCFSSASVGSCADAAESQFADKA